MATIETRKDRDGNIISFKVKIRRRGFPYTEKTFSVFGVKQSEINAAKKSAEAWARMIESEMDRGVFVSRAEAEATTLKEALERYAREVTPQKKGAKRELDRIERWKSNKLASRPLASLRGSDFAAFRDEWREAGKAENTIRLELALLSHLFKVARTDWGMEALANPTDNMSKPRGSQERDRRFLPGEEPELLKHLGARRNIYIKPAVEFAVATAMRQSEILGLRWDDIDLGRKVALLRDTKNGEARRVPLSPAALMILEQLPHRLDGKVFAVTQDGLIRGFASALAAARKEYIGNCSKNDQQPDTRSFVDLRFHDMRHEATSRLFEAGFNPMEVAAITGHKTLQMLKRYTHLQAETLAQKLAQAAS